MAMELDNKSFVTEVLEEKNVPVLVDFWAPWCGPCRSQAPILEQFAQNSGGSVKICKVNVDENEQIARNFGVMSIPTLIVFKNGQAAKKAVGLQNLQGLQNLILNI